MQGLGGSAAGLNRGATMSGSKGGTNSGTYGVVLVRTAGLTALSGTFVAASPGIYEFALYGGGHSPSGYAGGFALRRVRLRKDEAIPYAIAPWDSAGTNTTATFSDLTMMARSGTSGAAGGGSGGDVNLTGVGGAAPSYAGYVGGSASNTPGGGYTIGNNPGAGMIIITKIAD